MAARALLDYLPDFGETAEPLFEVELPAAGDLPMAAAEPDLPPPGPDIDAIVAAEVAAAEARLRGEFEEAREAALAEQRELHDTAMRQVQADLGEAAAARIAASFEEAATTLSGLVNSAVARMLSPILGDDIARRSVEELGSRIRHALADSDAVRITISGPPSMLESLGASLGDLAAQCEFVEASGFDVTATIDGTVLETRLAEWSALIGETV